MSRVLAYTALLTVLLLPSLSVSSCPECEAGSLSCKLISGLFTRFRLPTGHNYLTTIPRGACSLNVTFLRPADNRIAVRHESGRYILNGAGSSNVSGVHGEHGVRLHYQRGDQGALERVSAAGPITTPIVIELVVSEPNRGVEYRYIMPVADAPGGDRVPAGRTSVTGYPAQQPYYTTGSYSSARPGDQRFDGNSADPRSPASSAAAGTDFSWILKKLSLCSRTCGGGTVTAVPVCVRTAIGKVTADASCDIKTKPPPQVSACNRAPCPAAWVPGDWSMCSVTCGEGTRTQQMVCRQELSPNLSIDVSERACGYSPSTRAVQKCYLAPCSLAAGSAASQFPEETPRNSGGNGLENIHVGSLNVGGDGDGLAHGHGQDARDRPQQQAPTTEWIAQPWGTCSVTCGAGIKERRVHCVDTRGGLVPDSHCVAMSRPDSEAYCQVPCNTDAWLVSEWDTCSTNCGVGEQHRRVICLGNCPESSRPPAVQPCSRNTSRHCHHNSSGGQWLTGRWSVCTHSCGPGTQSRLVVCAIRRPHDRRVETVTDEQCAHHKRPRHERQCHIQRCKPMWYSSLWGQCSTACGKGERQRQVVCLSNGKEDAQLCNESMKPNTTEKCEGDCTRSDDVDEDDLYDTGSADYYDEDEFYDDLYGTQDAKTTWETVYAAGANSSGRNMGEYMGGEMIAAVMPVEQQSSPRHETANDNGNSDNNSHVNGVQVARSADPDCTDKFKNCNIAVQSGLCMYDFYQENCCRSCPSTVP